tara:strand:- start:212 stop:448 length:237 start_codon:yes stop_codon:yes gene_type:complete
MIALNDGEIVSKILIEQGEAEPNTMFALQHRLSQLFPKELEVPMELIEMTTCAILKGHMFAFIKSENQIETYLHDPAS